MEKLQIHSTHSCEIETIDVNLAYAQDSRNNKIGMYYLDLIKNGKLFL